MNAVERCQPLLGTYVEISLHCQEGTRAHLLELSSAAFAAIAEVDRQMSYHRPDSELTQLNRQAARAPMRVSAAMQTVLAEALYLSELSAGRFDVSIAPKLLARGLLPDHHHLPADPAATWQDIVLDGDQVWFRRPLLIDLGGIAKGFAVDQAMALISDHVSACINAGGDLRMNHWDERCVAVRLPGTANNQVLSIPMRAAALATSARAGHGQSGLIVEPWQSMPAKHNDSVSVFAATAMRADALTKLVWLDRNCAAILNQAGGWAFRLSADGRCSPLA